MFKVILKEPHLKNDHALGTQWNVSVSQKLGKIIVKCYTEYVCVL